MALVDYDETFLHSITDPEGILQCFEKYGAVGITDVLTKKECESTLREVESILIKSGVSREFKIDNPHTYHHTNNHINRYGVVGKVPLTTSVLNYNRNHPNVKKAYSIVYGLKEDDILPEYDRVGWMRPVIGPGGEDWSMYSTHYSAPGLHLDVDPQYYFEESKSGEVLKYLNDIPYNDVSDFVTENNVKNIKMGRQLQGVLNLVDNSDENGGFQFIPGGHILAKEWYHKNKTRFANGSPNGRYIFTKHDYQFLNPVRLPCPAGTLIIFDVALPHGTQPNTTDKNRVVQFLRYIPKNVFTKETLARRHALVTKTCAPYPPYQTNQSKDG
ncbi:WD repeat protein [Yasminevirus sp. GU-2018]|uniref:WD repeat protein n=1 Tax=Yasminevirus sp. GU-2018 TaxID=2420051 RepID=A0A5K0U7I2_9VIRU|nr:WD repeat protein [Yasminevirus sp. GU-2018]